MRPTFDLWSSTCSQRPAAAAGALLRHVGCNLGLSGASLTPGALEHKRAVTYMVAVARLALSKAHLAVMA